MIKTAPVAISLRDESCARVFAYVVTWLHGDVQISSYGRYYLLPCRHDFAWVATSWVALWPVSPMSSPSFAEAAGRVLRVPLLPRARDTFKV